MKNLKPFCFLLQISYLEQQLAAAKKEVDTLKQSTDKTKIHEAYTEEAEAFKVSCSIIFVCVSNM